MPFTTDAAWPAGLLKIFETCRHDLQSLQPLEDRYYGPYIKLLTYCFGPDSFNFFIAPQSPRNDTIEFPMPTTVFDAQHRPLLIAEIRDDTWATEAYLRFKADTQMRQQYNSMLYDCPLPHLWGLSLLGTSLRVYRTDVATRIIKPVFEGHSNPNYVLPFDFLEGAWNIDILSQEGFEKMKEIIGDILGSAVL
ncbi:hypothetical protein D9611_008189 [Ephemerocybe angulata]|uniref:Uncharacterized protein n=2 Tax=Ephemerocybe angulata TaxID=980116 RepID=A0A8H5FD11_9AGAR|nr:hypothetical protein D9611_008189 [Tulosesus angulatus]